MEAEALLMGLLLMVAGAGCGNAQEVVEAAGELRPAGERPRQAGEGVVAQPGPSGEDPPEAAGENPEEEGGAAEPGDFGELPAGPAAREAAPGAELFAEGDETGVPQVAWAVAPDQPAGWEETGAARETGGREADAFEDLVVPEPTHVGVVGTPEYAIEPYDAGVVESELLPRRFARPLEREGFQFGIGGQLNYDSNIFLDEEDEVSDFFLVISPAAEYRSAPEGVPGLIRAYYRPFVRFYLDESDLNTVDHSAGANLDYEGARLRVAASAYYGRFSRSDRFVGGLTETENISGSLGVAYDLTARTSVEAGWWGSRTQDDEGGGVGEESENTVSRFEVSGWWQATAKTRGGPAVRYSENSSGTTGDREALAFLVRVDTTPRQELNLSGSLGVERVEGDEVDGGSSTDLTGEVRVDYRPNDRLSLFGELSYEAIPTQRTRRFDRGGGGSPTITGQLVALYQPSELWTVRASARAESFPSPEAVGYSVGDQTYSVVLIRNLPRGLVSLGGDMSFSKYDDVGEVAEAREDQQVYSVVLRYNRWILGDRTAFDSSLRWSTSEGDRTWDRFQAAVGINYQF